jgi:Tfp pilus assembly protein PilF
MSVINNVLKNLESRESKFTPIEINSITSNPAPARDLKPLLLIAALLFTLAVVAWFYLQDQLFKNAPAALPAVASIASVVPSPVVQAAVEPEIDAGIATDQMLGNQIIGLQIRESEEDMRMEFALRAKVVVYLKERGENSFGYHLRDVESQIVAPLISDNRWIRELSIISSETGVDINFQTAADILVETRQELRDGEPIWSINLRKSSTPAGSESVVEVARGREPAVSESQPAAAPVELASSTINPQTSLVEEPAVPVEIDIKSTNPNTASINQLEYAVQLINSGRTAKAEALLQGLLGGVEDYNARQHLLALYGRQKQFNRARRLLRESMTSYPDAALFKTGYARSLFQSAAYRAVIELFASEISIDVTQQALVAASYQRLDEHDDAVRHYRLALAQDANNARNWIGLGISQEHTAALEEALNSYQRAVKLGGLNSRLRAFVAARSSTLEQVLN